MAYYLGFDQSSSDHRPLSHLINPLLTRKENRSSEDALNQFGSDALVQSSDALLANNRPQTRPSRCILSASGLKSGLDDNVGVGERSGH